MNFIEIKNKKSVSDYILAICDKDLLGKKINYKGLEIYINPRFYGKKLVNERELISFLKKATIINAIGKNSVNLIKKYFKIEEDKIIYINDIPHIQIITIFL